MKSQLTLPISLYDIKPYPGSRNYHLVFNSTEKLPISKLISDESKTIVLNFDEKKDKRTTKFDRKNDIKLSWDEFFCGTSYQSKADFIFNQNQFSKTTWNINFKKWMSENQTKEYQKNYQPISNTFTFNGNVGDITINASDGFCFFQNMIFKNKDKESKSTRNGYTYNYSSKSATITDEMVKALTFDNFESLSLNLCTNNLQSLSLTNVDHLDIDRITAQNLANLDLSCCSQVKLSIRSLVCPKLKTIDLSNLKKFEFLDNYDFYDLFSGLDGNYISKYSSSFAEKFNNKATELKNNIDKTNKRINVNCKFIFSPDTVIESDFFKKQIPDPENPGYMTSKYMTAKEVFPINKNGKVEVSLLDFVKKDFAAQEKLIQAQLQQMRKTIENISKNNTIDKPKSKELL